MSSDMITLYSWFPFIVFSINSKYCGKVENNPQCHDPTTDLYIYMFISYTQIEVYMKQ